MATIKNFTDIPQSKVLEKILPHESADYTRLGKDEDNVLTRPYLESCSSELKEWIGRNEIYPCWSLATLLNVLPSGYVIVKNYHSLYFVESRDHSKSTNVFNNPIDACVDMIIRLHELNLL